MTDKGRVASLLKQFSVVYKEKTFVISSPCCFLHTVAGTVPNLTKETLGYIDRTLLPDVLIVPLPQIAKHSEVFKSFSGDASELFAQDPKSIIYMSVQDSSSPAPTGHNTKNSVAVWDKGGKMNMTPQAYMKVVEAVQPMLYESLADGDADLKCSKKRIIKSVDRSLLHLQQCMNIHQDSKLLVNSNMLCLLEGGYSKEESLRCVKQVLKMAEQFNVWGFVLDSLPKEEVLSEDIKYLVAAVCQVVPPDKPVAVYKHGHPLSILDLLESGVSIFDTSYVTVTTRDNCAFIYEIPCQIENGFTTNKAKCIDYEHDINGTSTNSFVEKLDLADKEHAESFSPIAEACTCYTCINHTRAYIHHLINVNEMLAPVLIMIHNLHHFLTFFKALRKIKTFEELNMFRKCLIKVNSSCAD